MSYKSTSAKITEQQTNKQLADQARQQLGIKAGANDSKLIWLITIAVLIMIFR
jgi:hypothetical protein